MKEHTRIEKIRTILFIESVIIDTVLYLLVVNSHSIAECETNFKYLGTRPEQMITGKVTM